MLRKIAVVLVLVVVLATAFASAANLGVSGGTIQAGVDESLYCDANGVKVLGWGLETDTNVVNSVRIGDIDPACNGNAVFVSILGANGTVLTSAKADPFTAVAAGNSFPFAAQDPAKIEGIKIWIEGDK